jgi:hypothetical protein
MTDWQVVPLRRWSRGAGLTRADQISTGVVTRNAAGRPAVVGSTLVCRSCGVGGVVHTPPAPGSEAPACHGAMQAGRPVRCGEVRLRQPDDRMIGCRLYVDAVSGFTFWCTRGGPGEVLVGERRLNLQDRAVAI